MRYLAPICLLTATMMLSACGSEAESATADGSGVMIPQTDRKSVLLDVRQAETDAIWRRTIQTHAQLINNAEVLAKVVATRDVRKTQWFISRTGGEPWVDLAEHVHVGLIQGTSLIEVWVDLPSREDSTIIANSVCREYLGYLRKQQNNTYSEDRQIVEMQLDQTNAAITALTADYEVAEREGTLTEFMKLGMQRRMESLEQTRDEFIRRLLDLTAEQAHPESAPVRVVRWANIQ